MYVDCVWTDVSLHTRRCNYGNRSMCQHVNMSMHVYVCRCMYIVMCRPVSVYNMNVHICLYVFAYNVSVCVQRPCTTVRMSLV